MESCEEIKTPVLTEVGGKPRMNCLSEDTVHVVYAPQVYDAPALS